MNELNGGFQTIDIHAHFYPESYLKILGNLGESSPVSCLWSHPDDPIIRFWGGKTPPLDRTYYDFHSRVKEMDKQGVDIHCLSLT